MKKWIKIFSILMVVFAALPIMAQINLTNITNAIKISEMTRVTSAGGTELVMLTITNAPGTNKTITVDNLLASARYKGFTVTGTNVIISPTNGNLQLWTLTAESTATIDAADANFTETIRLNISGSNTLTWTTANLSNSIVLGQVTPLVL